MIGSVGSIILLIVIVGCIVYWFVLKKQIDEEESDRIEPHIDSSFSEFSQQELPKEYDADFDNYPEDEFVDNSFKDNQEESGIKTSDVKKTDNYDLFEDEKKNLKTAYKQGFFARLKESFFSQKQVSSEKTVEQEFSRPPAIRTVALILRPPEDQPYSGHEILEVAEDLKLMVGAEGFLQKIVTTYLGDEPMYSIAHMMHPGSFNDPDILDAEIPGLLFFAQIPGPDSQMNTVQALLQAAAYFGNELGGNLLDENQRPVDETYIKKLLVDVSEMEQQAWMKHRTLR